VPIIAYGAGTSVEGNTLAVQGGVALDLSRMTQIVAVNTGDFDCVAEAGVRREHGGRQRPDAHERALAERRQPREPDGQDHGEPVPAGVVRGPAAPRSRCGSW